MLNKKFEAYKVKRELLKEGSLFSFTRKEKNKFGEPTGNDNVVAKVKGLYHERTEKIELNYSGESYTRFRTKRVPMILCLWDSVGSLKIGDKVKFNGKEYEVNGIVNVQEWNIIADINLELIDDGNQD